MFLLAVGSLSLGLAVFSLAYFTLMNWWTRTWVLHRLTSTADSPAARKTSDELTVSDFLDAMARDVHSGYSLNLAFMQCAQRFPLLAWWTDPIAHHCLQGKSLAIAISIASPASQDAHISLAARTLSVASNGGFGIANSLEKCAAILRERTQLVEERNAQTAQIRLSTSLLSWIPLAICAWVLFNQSIARKFFLHSPLGLMCLLTGIVLNVVGRMWMSRITRTSA